MRSVLLLAVVLIWALAAPSHSASANRITPSKNELEGIEGYIEGKANGMVSRLVVDEAAGWVARAVAVVLSSAPSNGVASGAEALSNADLRAKIESLVSSELRNRLVSEVRSMVAREILGGNSNGSAGEEAGAIAGRAAEIFSSRINEIADRMAARIYDSAVDRVRGWILSNTRGTLDVTSLSDSMEGAFDPQTVAGILENSAARLIGESAAAAVRFRIEEALAGRLPPEVIEALERGPEEFERYASMVEGNLPGAKLRELSGSVLNRPVIKLPSAAYAAILAGSAAKHYARAYNGLTVDPYELRRAIEVTRVMVWQVENRDWINLSVMQIAGIARGLARSVGAASSFEAALEKLKGPFRKIQAAADKLDALVKKPIGEVRSEIAKAVKLLREELESVQRELLRPIREGIDEIGRGLARAGEAASDLIPEKFDGIPRTFRDLKDRAVALRSDRPSRPKLSPSADISEEEAVPAAGASESEELDPVLLHNGEFVYRATDLLIPGRGVDFRFTRICRSRSDFTGELGRRCTHSLAERLLPREGGFTLVDARGLKHFFRRSGGGFLSPPGLLADLVKTGSGHELVKPDGSVSAFDSEGRLVHRRDGYGNRIVLEYGENGLLDYAIDTYGRRITFERRKDGLISRMRDFAGRTFSYEYGALSELIGATAPATPEFPSGKTTAYRHDGAQRITMIMDPSGRPYLKNRFDSDGRVKAQSYGEGPWMTVSYAGSDHEDAGGVASRAWVTDAVGSISLYEHDGAGRLIRRWRFEDGRYALISRHLYDSLGRKEADCLPSGICEEYVYGEGPDAGVTTGVKIRAADGESFRLIIWGPGERGRRFNSFGQVVEEDDGKGGIIRYEYYPSFDPDGDGVKVRGAASDSTDGGYLKRIVRECSSVEFGYDPVGNIVWRKTGSEGKVRYRVNALNQVVREERP
ncbi:MAG TPA: DUF6531 domain-containing protein, partial [bacterium]|nr:DUF6531 domain-containing protein [bacterium]